MADKIGELYVEIDANTKKFDSGIDSAKKGTENFDKGLTSLSGTVKKLLGAGALIALASKVADVGKASIKAASDAQETNAKFNTAFAGITDQADAVAKSLVDNYGLSQTASENLLSASGDLIKGFGATATEALGTSTEIQQLAVDLASYNNLQGGASRASEILTKAYLGERDSLVSLGIKISDADVKQRLLEKGQQDLTGQALLLAKGNATLELAITQSGDAIGDFDRTSDSYANTLKVARARTEDLAVELGRLLLPAATEGVGVFAELTEKITDHIKALVDARQVYDSFSKGTETVNDKLFVVKKQIAENSVEIDKLEDMYSRATDPKFKKKWQEQLEVLYEQSQVARRVEAAIKLEIKAQQDLIDEQEKEAKLLEEKKKKEKEIADARAKQYIDQNTQVQAILDANKTEIELIDEQISSITKLSLADSTYRDDQQAALQLLQDQKATLIQEEIDANKAKTEAIQGDEDAFLAEQDAKGQEYQEKKLARLSEEQEAKKQAILEEVALRQQQAETLLGIIGNIQTVQLNEIETNKNAKIAALDEEVLGEEAYALAVSDIEKKAALESWKIEKEQLRLSKANSLIEIAINTAIGVSKALAQGGIFGIATGALVGAAGIAQAAAVLSQPEPPKPQLATGAVIAGSQRGVDVTVGEGGNDELILGGGSQGEAILSRFAQKLDERMGSNGGQTIVNINSLYPPRQQDLDRLAKDIYTGTIKEQQRRGIQ